MRRTALCLAGLLVTTFAGAAEAPVTITRGDWSATVGAQGLTLTYGGQVVSQGAYLTVFKPGYSGSVLSLGEAWKAGQVQTTPDGTALTLSADLPGGRVLYEVALESAQVRISLRVRLAAGAEVGPVEYPLAMVPVSALTDGQVEMANAAGTVTSRTVIPAQPVKGGIAASGPVMVLRTPQRNLVFEAADFGSVYAFDARHENYRGREGIWAFASPAVQAGEETSAVYTLRVEPPAPPRTVGQITLGEGVAAGRILLAPGATPREVLAA